MKMFVLLATMWYGDAPADVWVIDSGISGEDCVYAMIELEPLMRDNVALSCEFDAAAEVQKDLDRATRHE